MTLNGLRVCKTSNLHNSKVFHEEKSIEENRVCGGGGGYYGNTVVVGIPCYNEEITIKKVIEDIYESFPSAKIFVFDNNSSDRTYEVAVSTLKDKNGSVIRVKDQGKGNVVLRFFSDIDADIYVLIDGDSTYDCKSIPKMVDKVLNEHLDMIVGRRIEVEKDLENKTYRKGHRFGNKILTNSVSLIFDQRADRRKFRDMLSGFRVMSKRYVKSFLSMSSGFEIETQLNVHALQLKMPCGEIDTPYFPRPEGSSSKLSTYQDGMRILITIIKLYSTEKPFIFYSVIGGILGIGAFLLAIPILSEFLKTGLVPRLPTALLATGMMLSAIIAFFSGLLLENVTKGRLEMKRSCYLKNRAPWKR